MNFNTLNININITLSILKSVAYNFEQNVLVVKIN